MREQAGYASREFADCYRALGDIVELPRSGARLLRRPLDGDHFDLTGLFPYTCCRDWGGLSADLAELKGSGAVSLVLVGNPFEDKAVRRALAGWDVCREHRTQWVVDLRLPWRDQRSKKTRHHTRKGYDFQEVYVSEDPRQDSTEFTDLFAETAARKRLAGIHRLPRATVRDLLRLGDATLVLARDGAGVVGGMLCIQERDRTFAHLLALARRAYEQYTCYALYDGVLQHFEARGSRLLFLGGGAGNGSSPADGLVFFKRRWANTNMPTVLGGATLDQKAYDTLSAKSPENPDGFFPAYRRPGGPYPWRA